MGRGDFFPKNAFHWGTNFVGKINREITLHGETNDQGEVVSQNAFSSDLNTKPEFFFTTMVEYSLEGKALTIL